ncbi:hypothetical protein D3C71_1927390 [compost metagenome]
MRDQAFLTCFGQIVRQEQYPCGAQTFSFLRVSDRLSGRATGAGENWHFTTAGVDSNLDDF